jgi:2-oxoglutarate dehydrogenase E1 component
MRYSVWVCGASLIKVCCARNIMSQSLLEQFEKTSYLSAASSAYVESLYEQFLVQDECVPKAWQDYFNSLQGGCDASHASVRDRVRHAAANPSVVVSGSSGQDAVNVWIDTYRCRGHMGASLDPLGLHAPEKKCFARERFALQGLDSSAKFDSGGLLSQPATLDEIESVLKKTYQGSIGFEYMHVVEDEARSWFQDQVARYATYKLSAEERLEVLSQVEQASGMERHLGTQYVGQKRFGLEGGESLIVALQALLAASGPGGVDEIVLGMAHRGRLNVMVNVLGMSMQELEAQFSGNKEFGKTSGDVKYHLGYTSRRDISGRSIKVQLAFNPSHLEAIGAVMMGMARARKDQQGHHVLPVVIHGDAAVIGQGIVSETVNMSGVAGNNVGGVVRIVVNNEIGFTAGPKESRSTHYCTDGLRGFGVPVLHVNADDPEAVVFCARLAFAYRERFKKDVVIDLVCYRRLGHNEADEPSGTNPIMYQKIKTHDPVVKIYAQQLVTAGVCTEDEVVARQKALQQKMKQGVCLTETTSRHIMGSTLNKKHRWHPYIEGQWTDAASTQFKEQRLVSLAKQIKQAADKVTLQPQVAGVMKAFIEMAEGKQRVRWGFAETMAYAGLLDEGFSVRLLGQDSGRGTFAHRHAMLHDYETGAVTFPLQAPSYQNKDSQFYLYNSVLSEQSCLGFEYGYAISDPKTLVVWEAQFGDFANGAQIIIDQFVSSGWQKWQRLCGLVMLLPHGYEGMGPEHSSARLERFLQLTAQQNIQVCVPSTPAQIFHLLRRQMLRSFRKPLVVFTPKSLLRLDAATSSLQELATGSFQLVIPEHKELPAKRCKRVILCSGKVYYDLLARREEKGINDVAIIRIEQLYPFPYDVLTKVIQYYGNVTKVIWCQEEPKNQGTWYTKRHCIERCLGARQQLEYVGRQSFSAPACGYPKLHKMQQSLLVDQALGLEKIEHEEGE